MTSLVYHSVFSVMVCVDIVAGTRDSDGRSAHFIHNLQDRESTGLQKLKVSNKTRVRPSQKYTWMPLQFRPFPYRIYH